MWERCPVTGKIEVCPSNLWKLRAIVGVSGLGVGYLASYALPFIGFGDGGIISGTVGASWQAAIGNVVAGSPFAILQSLGATSAGALLCGGVGGGLGLLAGLVASGKIDWCACQYSTGQYD